MLNVSLEHSFKILIFYKKVCQASITSIMKTILYTLQDWFLLSVLHLRRLLFLQPTFCHRRKITWDPKSKNILGYIKTQHIVSTRYDMMKTNDKDKNNVFLNQRHNWNFLTFYNKSCDLKRFSVFLIFIIIIIIYIFIMMINYDYL